MFRSIDPALLTFLIGALLLAALWASRFWLRQHAHRRGHEFEMVTLLVRLPKVRKEEETKWERTQQKIQEEIAADETFFSALAGLTADPSFRGWFLGRRDSFSFEIVAHQGLIKFYVAVPRSLRQFLEEQITAQHPDAFIEEVEDYNIFAPTGVVLGAYLTFRRESVFPIRTYRKLESDPLNAITNALSNAPEGGGAAIQYVVRSAPKKWRRLGVRIAHNMQQGMELSEAKRGRRTGEWLRLLQLSAKKKEDLEPKREHQLSEAEREMAKGLEEKAGKGGLDVNVRLIASAPTPESARSVLNGMLGAFSVFNIYEYGNAFSKVFPPRKRRLVSHFIGHAFDDSKKIVLNNEEMAGLWHLPLKDTETPNILWLTARTATAPPNLPTEGLILGQNIHRGRKILVRVKKTDRQRHMYLIGKSGSGKTVFIQNMALQDIQNGEGVAVLDPHGDMIEWLLGNIPKHRVDDVIVFDPSDMERPVGLNMLEAEDEMQKDMAVQEMIAIFYKLFPPEMMGPMFEHNMRNVMLTLMADPKTQGTLVEIPRMFSDPEYQSQWIAKVKDPIVRSFWENEMAKTTDYHKSEMLGYLISKVGRFVENTMMRNIIGQQKSGFNFRQIMDEGKVLLVNLAKGRTGEINASLLGMIIVSKLQMAALARADLPEEQRRDFYLYIDEFQNFITDSIATILSEARKYRLNLIVGHQYLGQLVRDGKAEIRDAVLGNVGSTFVSRIGPEDAEILEKLYSPVFSGYDLINSDQFTWYVKLIVDNTQVSPFTMKTIPPGSANAELAQAVKQLSRLKYGRDRGIVEAEVLERSRILQPATPPASGSKM